MDRPLWHKTVRSPKPGQCSLGLLATMLIVLFLLLGAMPSSAQRIRMKSAQFDPLQAPQTNTALPGALAARQRTATPALQPNEQQLVLIQWDDGLSEEKLNHIKDLGGKLIEPIPDHAYLASMPSSMDLGALTQSSRKAAVDPGKARWIGKMAAGWKLHPMVTRHLSESATAPVRAKATGTSTTELMRYNMQLAYTGGEQAARETIKKLCRTATLNSQAETYETWTIEADPAAIATLAGLNCVFWIEPDYDRKPAGERSGLVMAGAINAAGTAAINPGSYASWLNKVGLSGDGIIVQVMDDGLSQGNTSNLSGTAHPDILGRIAGIDNATYDMLGNSTGGHGHLNASIILGDPLAGGGRMKDSGGFVLGQGIAPKARVYATKMLGNATNRTYDSLVRTAQEAGAKISSNSWYEAPLYDSYYGDPSLGEYTVGCQTFDRLTRDANSMQSGMQPMVFCFAAGNKGYYGATSITSPASAKNVISVGATENFDKGELDGSGVGASESDDIRDMAVFSSRGPTVDKRFAPTLVAPGTHITGAASDDKNYTGDLVSGRYNVLAGEDWSQRKYYPARQNYYTWSSGTSHSCPAVAGAATLYYQYHLKKFGQPPSPAMVKAALVAGAVDPAGGLENDETSSISLKRLDPIPNNNSGWGRVSLASLVDQKMTQFIVDQSVVFSYSTQAYSKSIQVVDPTKPLRVVLAWTDPAASPLATRTLINDLDLTVSDGIYTWKGNVFEDGVSVPNTGKNDTINNLECVFIPTPRPAIYTVTVRARDLTGDALPGQGGSLQQDFALFVSNGASQTPMGRIMLDRDYYASSNTVNISLSDADLKGKGKAQVTLASLTTGDSEVVTLNEVLSGSGILSGSMKLTTTGTKVNNNAILTVRNGEKIQVTYLDVDTLDSSDNPYVVTDQAYVDTQAPSAVSQVLSDIDEQSAKLTVNCNEPTQIMLEVATRDPNVTTGTQTIIANSFSTLHEISFGGLLSATPYFYRFTLTDRAGNTKVYDDGGVWYCFQTKQVQNLFMDTLEPGPISGWSHFASVGLDDWASVTPRVPTHSATHAWFSRDDDVVKDASLVTPSIYILPNSSLSFWHTYQFEPRGIIKSYDGGVIEISTDQGMRWQDLGPKILYGFYNSTIDTNSGNPLGGRRAWSGGEFGLMSPVSVDLSSFAGQTVKVRFRIGCNKEIGGGGWYIDDIAIKSALDGVGNLAQIDFDADGFNCSDTMLRFTIRDQGLSKAAGVTPMGIRLASSSSYAAGVPIYPQNMKLIDNQGIWEGYLSVEKGSTPKTVKVAGMIDNVKEGDTIRLIYNDPDVAGYSRTVSDEIVLDCTAPKMLNQQTTFVGSDEVDLAITANEPVLVRIQYGASLSEMTQSIITGSLSTTANIQLSNLLPNTPYFYQIDLIDRGLNVTQYNRDGYFYGVKTGVMVLETDTLDPSPAWAWRHYADQGTDTWTRIVTDLAHSPDHAWFARSESDLKDASLQTPPFEVTAGMMFHFWHTYVLEQGNDGAVIEISSDGGSTWHDLGPDIIQGGYNQVISAEHGSPIPGRQAWSGGALGLMTEVVVDLTRYVGSQRLIRFRLGCDTNDTLTGWFIDDIGLERVQFDGQDFPAEATGPSPANNATGVSIYQPLTLSWKADVNSDSYQVYWGTDQNSLSLLDDTTSPNTKVSQNWHKAGTRYYWQVLSFNSFAVSPGPIWSYKTMTVDSTRMANHLIKKSPGLTVDEQRAADYDANGKIEINDLVTNISRQK